MADSVAVFVATLALALSIWQFRWTVRRARFQTTFEQLREVTRLLQRATRFDFDQIAQDCLAFYRGDRDDLSEGGAELVNLLNALDLLCFGIAKGEIEGSIVKSYLSSSLHGGAEAYKKHIRDIRACYGDNSIYLHFYDLIPEFSRAYPGR